MTSAKYLHAKFHLNLRLFAFKFAFFQISLTNFSGKSIIFEILATRFLK